jgi:general secretion pathway protein H
VNPPLNLRRVTGSWSRGFTFIELLLVIAINGLGSALVSLALPNPGQNALMRDADRLAALLEAARAQSRATGLPVRWHATAHGFVFDGLPASAPPLPTGWLDAQTYAVGNASAVLGPDPIIAAQTIELRNRAAGNRTVDVTTDGLAPFHVVTVQ